MGSVNLQSPQSQASSRGERLSALVDGEAFDGDHGQFLAELGRADRAAWAQYHVIGDALRSDELTLSPAFSASFMTRVSVQLEAEPHLLAPASHPVASRLNALRRKVVPAFAVAAAAATLTWIVVPQMQVASTGSTQIASAGAQPGGLQRVAATQSPQDVNIIRDASLDQYLEAHQQFAQQSVVTGSMPLIRAAMTTTPGQ
ncbi:sigma-E factor negative regulatory protein [Burkholderia guangdongensis]|uniref:sigma-E factor negative regulatory protein n=1 Tax=Burkholderia guangdongensis TaxID=1792500 RepID=UPI0015CC7E23|nr:sigma-E factor negative regulatory protein [Burkholderia guangdongensis]